MTTTYNSESAVKALGVTDTTLTQDEKNFLDENGYLPLPGILDAAQIDALRNRLAELLAIEKDKAGLEVHQEAGTARLANLVGQGRCLPRLLHAPATPCRNRARFGKRHETLRAQ